MLPTPPRGDAVSVSYRPENVYLKRTSTSLSMFTHPRTLFKRRHWQAGEQGPADRFDSGGGADFWSDHDASLNLPHAAGHSFSQQRGIPNGRWNSSVSRDHRGICGLEKGTLIFANPHSSGVQRRDAEGPRVTVTSFSFSLLISVD